MGRGFCFMGGMFPKKLGGNVRFIEIIPRYFRVTDACRYTGLPELHLKRAIERGEIQSFVVGTVALVDRREINQWVRQGRVVKPKDVPPPKPPDPRVKADVIAKHYSVSVGHILKLARSGEIPGIRVGQAYRFDFAAVVAAIEGKPFKID